MIKIINNIYRHPNIHAKYLVIKTEPHQLSKKVPPFQVDQTLENFFVDL